MRPYKRFIVKQLASFGIFVYRKAHESDFQLSRRIEAEQIRNSGGVLHIGAHEGQEAAFYAECGSKVLWIEAEPEVFNTLSRNISEYAQQKAICALLGSEDRKDVPFNLASNKGASSSIYLPNVEANPLFTITTSINLNMRRLDSLISPSIAQEYKHWVVDVQGAELPVLLGAGKLIEFCNSIVVEAKNDSFYKGGTRYSELHDFLLNEGFIPLWGIEKDSEENICFIRVQSRKRL